MQWNEDDAWVRERLVSVAKNTLYYGKIPSKNSKWEFKLVENANKKLWIWVCVWIERENIECKRENWNKLDAKPTVCNNHKNKKKTECHCNYRNAWRIVKMQTCKSEFSVKNWNRVMNYALICKCIQTLKICVVYQQKWEKERERKWRLTYTAHSWTLFTLVQLQNARCCAYSKRRDENEKNTEHKWKFTNSRAFTHTSVVC